MSKKKKKQLRQLYRISDPEMYQEAKTMKNSFVEDKADFINFDPDFADPFAANWQADIDAGEVFDTDETIDDVLTGHTAAVKKEMQNCRNKFQDTKYFIEKAFSDNRQVWNEFGYEQYKRVRQSPVAMSEVLEKLHDVAEKYKVELIAKGYSQAMINDITTVRTALDQAAQKKALYIGNIPVQTRARYAANDKVWQTMKKVNKVGKRIYNDNWARYQRYLMPVWKAKKPRKKKEE